MILWAIGLLSKSVPGPAASLIVASTLVGAGFAGGMWMHSTMDDAREARELSQEVRDLRESFDRVDFATLQNARDDTDSARRLQEEVDRLTRVTGSLQDETSNLVEVAGDLELSAGFVRLLNDAINGREAELPTDPSGASPYSDPTPSGVDAERLVGWQLVNIEQYNIARERCNALIDWAEENLIDTPLAEKDNIDTSLAEKDNQ